MSKSRTKLLRVLVAPAHYQLLPDGGSESTVAWEFLDQLSKHAPIEGRAITGWCATDSVGRFAIDRLYRTKPASISNLDRLRLPFQAYRRAADWLEREPFDLVWHLLPFGANQTFSLIALRQLAARHGVPLIIGPLQTPPSGVSDDEWARVGRAGSSPRVSLARRFERWSAGAAQSWFAGSSRRTLERADHLLVVSEPARQFWTEYGLDPSRMSELPYGIDPTPYRPPRQPRTKRFDIVKVGYLVQRKRTSVLIEAFARLVKQYPTATLTLIGSGPKERWLKEKVRELGLLAQIRFEGYVPYRQIPARLAAFDCFAGASTSEAFPHIYLEAMAAGLPLVAFDHPGGRALVRHGQTGLLLPLADPHPAERVAEAMLELATDPSRRAAMGLRARALVRTTYAWLAVTERFVEIVSALHSPKRSDV